MGYLWESNAVCGTFLDFGFWEELDSGTRTHTGNSVLCMLFTFKSKINSINQTFWQESRQPSASFRAISIGLCFLLVPHCNMYKTPTSTNIIYPLPARLWAYPCHVDGQLFDCVHWISSSKMATSSSIHIPRHNCCHRNSHCIAVSGFDALGKP